jgi:hypothetical protein
MKFYLTLTAITLSCFLVVAFLPNETLQALFATPGVLALAAIIYQLIRDQISQERKVELQKMQHVFNIGTTSHMANVAFDKHVEFCEKYMKELHDTSHTLFHESPTVKAIDHAKNFIMLRQGYAVWITEDINENLSIFEQALVRLGATREFLESTLGHKTYNIQRQDKINTMYKDFKAILSMNEGEKPDPDIAIEEVKKKVREILNLEDLVLLRKNLIDEARDQINK